MTAADVIAAFRSAFVSLMGVDARAETIAVLVAQSALECARWASMHCYNFGNIRPPANWAGDYCQFRCNEKIGGKWVWFDPPSAGSNFVAFENASDGAAFYLSKLRGKWPEAWTAALAGDAAGFVHGLKLRGYFTADEAPYLKAVMGMYSEFLAHAQVPASQPFDFDALRSVVGSSVVIAPALLVGAQGTAVGVWQGVVGADVTNVFDAATESKTRAWQTAKKLPVTGYVAESDLQAAGLT